MVVRAWDWLRGRKPLVDAFFATPVLLLTLAGLVGDTYQISKSTYALMMVVLTLP